ncbi:MAG TPA: hypothetical protein VFP37_09960 [Steroidobacteraceae bacterium]|nr:hypothetical protein [Steroidobacteraceae bacterium]
MPNPMTFRTTRRRFDAAATAALHPLDLERHRLERLLDLRAAIDSIRAERTFESPVESGALIRRQAG